ncbi:MAG TPA: hypothetical protein VGL07_15120 [Buttiauxella sp.]
MTRSELETIIQAYRDAERAVLAGKSITMNGQSMTMENLSDIRKGLTAYETRLASFDARQRGRPRYKLARFL